MPLKNILNDDLSPKSSAVIKTLFYWLLFLIFLFTTGSFLTKLFPASWNQFVYGIGGTCGALLATWILLKIEKKSFADYKLTWEKNTFFRFLKGIAIGTVIFIALIAFLLSFTSLQLQKNTAQSNPWAMLWYLSIIPLALMEEIAFRAYPFLKLNKVFGLGVTQVIIAIAFALYHVLQGWNIQVAFLGPGVWAFVFGLAAVWSKGIALPTGIHVSLNLIQRLIGIKPGEAEPIWLLNHPENTPASAITHTELIGTISQLLILVMAILFMEYYIRKKT